jgi:hypothetical protein
MSTEEVDEIIRYGASINEPSMQEIRKAFSPEDTAASRIHAEEKVSERLKMSQDHKKEVLQLENSHQLAIQKQTHALNEAKVTSRLAAGIFSFILITGIAITLYGPKENKKFGETIAATAMGVLTGFFIGTRAANGGTSF